MLLGDFAGSQGPRKGLRALDRASGGLRERESDQLLEENDAGDAWRAATRRDRPRNGF